MKGRMTYFLANNPNWVLQNRKQKVLNITPHYVVVPTAYITSFQRVLSSNTNQLVHQRVLEWWSSSLCSINCLRALVSWDTTQSFLNSCALKMETAGSSYTVAPACKATRRNIKDGYELNFQICKNLRSLQVKFDRLITACLVWRQNIISSVLYIWSSLAFTQ
jgi:hypothetical protein